MASVLETLIAFVVVMLVLALAAQSLQEAIKVAWPFKRYIALNALRGLVREAAGAHQQMDTDGDDILREVVRRLQALGQKGFGKNGIRLDSLTGEQLRELIAAVDPAKVGGLQALGTSGVDRLKEIAKQAGQWFPLAMNPTEHRYKRRMRMLAFGTSTLVVLALNADAIRLLRTVRSDPALQARLSETGGRLVQLDSLLAVVQDSIALRAQAADSQVRQADSLRARRDSLRAAQDTVSRATLADLGPVFAGRREWGDPSWWAGILFSILLVGLGAPFWHDALETLFGFKQKVRAVAAGAPSQPPSGGTA
jgi:hypothetical protein